MSIKVWGLSAFLIFHVFSSPVQAELVRFGQIDLAVYRGSKPVEDEDYQKLKNLGIRTIVNLEILPTDVEPVRHQSQKWKINFFNIPIDPILVQFEPDLFKLVLILLTDHRLHPIYVHCMRGADRTGLVAAMYRIHVQGWSAEAAYSEMISNGFKPHLLLGLNQFFEEHKIPGSLNLFR